jgi:dipeptidyl aminopeptidase/acylaminoacyl peptidase
VGDIHSRSTLAITSKSGKPVWLAPPEAAGSRPLSVRDVQWTKDGKTLISDLQAVDHKDRWVVKIDPDTAKSSVLFTDHNDAWLGGPGEGTVGWLPDRKRLYVESEKDGWAHLYTVNIENGETKQITSGPFEVSRVRLSKDGTKFFFISSEGSPFKRHFDSVSVDGGKDDTIDGDSNVVLSPDETHGAYLRSWINHPPELFVANIDGKESKVTESPSAEWLSYKWSTPERVEIPASDGVRIPGDFYRPAHFRRGGPAVIFVHGAGYLQNVHDWWKDAYYREYMFHNLLATKGVAVLDLDYRASAGYGRDWRTAVYRFMGGRDLDDNVDGAHWLVSKVGVDPKRVGIYGGSYGGFLTLMAMFTKPGVFAAGAALRPVSDWANYNDGYTSDILNLPQDDPVAYRKSSPIFHADGLEGTLLICHGVVDTNVHYQDTVRLVQRLIDLKKENWSVAFYPMEDHTFSRQSSWSDEYRRILKLFQETLHF